MARRIVITIVALLLLSVSIPSIMSLAYANPHMLLDEKNLVNNNEEKNEQIETALTITEEFTRAKNSRSVSQFNDLKVGESGYEEVLDLVERNIINGYGDNTFEPFREISRQHVAALLYRALDLKEPSNVKRQLASVSDVSVNHDYATEIAAVMEANIFKGSNGKFNPRATMTRGQMASVLVRAFNLTHKNKPVHLIDLDKIEKSHRENVKILAQNEVTIGKLNNKKERYFDATGRLNRVQFSILLQRTLTLSESDEYIEDKQYEKEIEACENEVIKLTNNERKKHGLTPLKIDYSLRNTARVKSQDMYVNDYFSHTSPVYGSFGQLLNQFNVDYRLAGENIAIGYRTPEAVVVAWMESPGHRQNILNESFTHIGVGYVKEKNISTQHFKRER